MQLQLQLFIFDGVELEYHYRNRNKSYSQEDGNIVVFEGSGSFTLPNSCAGVASVRKANTGVSRTHTAACEKMGSSSCGRGNLRTGRRRIPVDGEPLERAKHQAE